MSVSVIKSKDVTVITFATDKNSMLPPLCQVLKTLCYSPTCCPAFSVYRGMMPTSVTAALGTIQIMVGLFNLGLGPGRISMHPEDFSHLGVAYWLGGVFLVTGILSVLAGRFSSYCSVGLAVFMNIAAAIISIAGIVMYSRDLSDIYRHAFCGWEPIETSENYMCQYVESYYVRLLTALDITMIVLIVLQMCAAISLAVLGIKAMCKRANQQDVMDIETSQPELKQGLLSSPGA